MLCKYSVLSLGHRGSWLFISLLQVQAFIDRWNWDFPDLQQLTMWASCYYWLCMARWMFCSIGPIRIIITYFVSLLFPWSSFQCFVAQFEELFLLANSLPLPRWNGLRACKCRCFKLLIKELVKAGLIETAAAACLQRGSQGWQEAAGAFKNTRLVPAGPFRAEQMCINKALLPIDLLVGSWGGGVFSPYSSLPPLRSPMEQKTAACQHHTMCSVQAVSLHSTPGCVHSSSAE